jgi:hypothetical protein
MGDVDCKYLAFKDLQMLIVTQHDGQTTLNQPPNTQTFDPANWRRSLHPSHQLLHSHSGSTTPSSATSDVSACMQLMTRMVDAIVPASGTATLSSGRPASPVESSPPIPSPSDISCYLTYASEKLGVRSAQDFISPLKRKSYGPDILSEVPDSDLADLGIPPGDIIQLKKGSEGWWKKKKRDQPRNPEANFFSDTHQREELKEDEEDNSIGYEYKYPDGGGVRYGGPPMIRGDQGPHKSHNCHTTYFNQALKEMVPIPTGFTAPPYGNPEENLNYWK